MSDRFRPETVMNAIVAGQLKATTVPLRDDDNDDETIHTPPPPPIEKSPNNDRTFGGFPDFELDLSCLSMTNVLPRTPSPPPSPILSRSVSMVRQLRPLTKPPAKRQSSPLLPPMASLSLTRGTWPSSDYAGRGTPIDKTRRSEWGGILGEEVGEDGVLLSSTVIGSFDYPKPTSHRSVSPDWNYVSSSSPPSLSGTQKRTSTGDELPELAPIEIKGLDIVQPDEWDSIMEAVLKPADVIANGENSPQPEDKQEKSLEAENDSSETKVDPTDVDTNVTNEQTPVPPPEPSEMPETEPVLDLQAGLDAALDMGLGLNGGRMNLFVLGLLPQTGRDSPSVYSSQSNPPPQHASPPPSALASDHRDRESTANSASGKLEGNSRSSRLGGKNGWRKMFGRMCRLSSVLHMQKGKH